MVKILNKSILFLVFLIIAGCATTYKYGEEFNVENVNQIKIGVTTQEDVMHLFGKPLRKGIANGNDVFIYSRVDIIFENNDNVKRKGNTLVIEFDNNGKVKNYYLNIPSKESSLSYYFYHKMNKQKEENEEEEPLQESEI